MGFSVFDLIPGVGAIKAVLNPLAAITGSIADWQSKKLNAQTEQERIHADENISMLRAKQAVLVAESGSKINQIVRAGLALPVVFLVNKILIWDKALGQWTGGRTDSLSEDLWNIIWAVLGFYLMDNFRKSMFGPKK